ncbi:Alpha/Beta hydrolase protein [Mycena olivaceomarginata]|nr:Alpha/Beta hydrolase protein [Mycena olivaceomarginata]
MASRLSRYGGYALIIPPLLVASYVFASLPITQKQLPGPVDPGLASLPLNSRARGGVYVQLPMGRVRSRCIVLVHGISIPSFAFARLAPILAAAGYRDTAYDPQLYVVQLALLLQHLQWTRARLIGFSMGGAIAASFPDVVLIASAGAGRSRVPVSRFAHWSFFEWLTRRELASRATSANETESPLQEIVRLQAEHLRGYTRALISSYRDGLIEKLQWAFSSSAWRGRRVLLINGDRDIVVPPVAAQVLRGMLASVGTATSSANSTPDESEAAADAPPDVSLVPVPGAGHHLIWTHTDEVARAILKFLGAGGLEVAAATEQGQSLEG